MSTATQVLHYAIESQLGEGGMGVVFRAIDTRLDRPVALKFLPEGLSVQEEAKRRLVLEAKAAANLDHPNIGVIHDIEEADGRLFIVMALYEGQTLQARFASGPVEALAAADWALQVASGLAKAHEAGIVHRDVKPANLFLTSDGLVKILDFGLVKLDDVSGLTLPGSLVGTPEYMAPEQVRGQPADPRADIWALGVVLYEALTATSPFRGEGGIGATIMRVMTAVPAPLAALAPGVPASFQAVLDRALEKDPEQRYASIRAFAYDLERAVEGARALAAPEVMASLAGSPEGAASAATSAGATRAAASWLGPGAALQVTAATAHSATTAVTDVTLAGSGASPANALLETVPRLTRFVGRTHELEHVRSHLERRRIVAIRGMAGEGKSALGARLVRDLYPESHICWFTFDAVEKNTVDALFWSLGAFLAAAGETLLWRYLRGEIEAHRPLDRTARLNLFLTSLGATEFAFCFDEVHIVAHDPAVGELFKALLRSVAGRSEEARTSFVIMGRDVPTDLEHLAVSLSGLSHDGVEALLEAHGLDVPAPLIGRLRERTRGNPTLLELALSALERMGDDHTAMASFIESMAGKPDIRDYVMNHVVADLEPAEKVALEALSIFPVAVDIDVAEEALADVGLEGAASRVASLVQKAIVHETEAGQLFCHDLVREYCYRTLDSRSRRRLHQRAGAYYETVKNPLRAAYHVFEQGDAERSLALLAANVKPIVEAGGAASLLEQLARFDPRALDDEQRFALVLAKGDVLAVRGANAQALELYQDALVDVLEEEERAELLARLGRTCNELGDNERAIEYATEGLESLSAAGVHAGRAQLQRVLGMALYRLGRLEEARAAFADGLAQAEADDDVSLAAYLDQYLGLVETREQRLDEARQRFERSRRAFRSQRDRLGEAEAMGNLAVVHGMLGQHERERSLLMKVLELLEQVGDVGYLLILNNNLGYVEHRAGRFEHALERFERLVELARRVEHRLWIGAGLVGVAENLLALGRTEAAFGRAAEAHDLLLSLSGDGSQSVELALAERVLGDIHLVMGDAAAARSWFEASIPKFESAHEADELERARRALVAITATSRADEESNHGTA